MNVDDYNYPLVLIYRYVHAAALNGAAADKTMIVKYAVALRAEFIPEGERSGPCRTMYFKVFEAGTSGVVGALLGWPTLDLPVTAQGEGLGWCTHTRMDLNTGRLTSFCPERTMYEG